MRAAWPPAQLARAKANGYDKPQPFERSRYRRHGDEEESSDPADFAIDDSDPRELIVDFDSVKSSELQPLCDHFGAALNWATKTKTGNCPI